MSSNPHFFNNNNNNNNNTNSPSQMANCFSKKKIAKYLYFFSKKKIAKPHV